VGTDFCPGTVIDEAAMTLFGKILVMVNLAFSAIMAVAALGLYATGLDYGPESKKDTSPKPPARVTALQKDITETMATMKPIEESWRTTRAELLRDEEKRANNRRVYDFELTLLRQGPAMNKDQQVRAVVIGPDHLPVVDPATKLPQMADTVDRIGQPLRPMATYVLQMEAVRKENEAILANLEKEIRKDEGLTNLLVGDMGKRGLRQMLVDERDKREGIVAEYNSVRPLFINIAVESQLVRKRLSAMQVQIEQLKSYLRKLHKVDVAMDRR
jgi:hypothetical protein